MLDDSACEDEEFRTLIADGAAFHYLFADAVEKPLDMIRVDMCPKG